MKDKQYFYLSTGLSVIWADQSDPYTSMIILCTHVYACLQRGVYTTVMNLQIGDQLNWHLPMSRRTLKLMKWCFKLPMTSVKWWIEHCGYEISVYIVCCLALYPGSFLFSTYSAVLQYYCSWTVYMHYSPALSEYTPIYMVCKIPKISGIAQW